MVKKCFDENNLKFFTLSDLIGRTVDIKRLAEEGASGCTITLAYDINSGEVFILDLSHGVQLCAGE